MTERTKRISPWLIILSIVAVVGFAAHVAVLMKGQKLFGSTDGVPWNILVAAYGFLAGAAAGVSFFASLGDVAGIPALRRISGPATLAALATLVPALVAIGSDLGNPLAAYGFLTSPNFSSPMWWMAMTYGAVLALRAIKVWGMTSGKGESLKWLSWPGLALAVVAPGLLGALFSTVAARPLWYGTSTIIFVVVLALAIGAAVTLVTAVLAGATESYSFIGRSLAGLLVALAVITFVKVSGADAAYGALILNGPYTFAFWGLQVLVGIVLPLVLLLSPMGARVTGALVSACSVLVGGFAAWLVQVLAGQGLAVMPELAYKAYSVTGTEIVMVIGIFALVGVLYALATQMVLTQNRSALGGD